MFSYGFGVSVKHCQVNIDITISLSILQILESLDTNNQLENGTYADSQVVEMPSLLPNGGNTRTNNQYSAVATTDDIEDGTSAADKNHATMHIKQLQVKRNGQVRFCRKCNLIKPDRTHHCSICDSCILRFGMLLKAVCF